MPRTTSTGNPQMDAALDELWARVENIPLQYHLLSAHSAGLVSGGVVSDVNENQTQIYDGDLVVDDYRLVVAGKLIVGDVAQLAGAAGLRLKTPELPI